MYGFFVKKRGFLAESVYFRHRNGSLPPFFCSFLPGNQSVIVGAGLSNGEGAREGGLAGRGGPPDGRIVLRGGSSPPICVCRSREAHGRFGRLVCAVNPVAFFAGTRAAPSCGEPGRLLLAGNPGGSFTRGDPSRESWRLPYRWGPVSRQPGVEMRKGAVRAAAENEKPAVGKLRVFGVELPGFEPRITGPESVVLPLHHSSMTFW